MYNQGAWAYDAFSAFALFVHIHCFPETFTSVTNGKQGNSSTLAIFLSHFFATINVPRSLKKPYFNHKKEWWQVGFFITQKVEPNYYSCGLERLLSWYPVWWRSSTHKISLLCNFILWGVLYEKLFFEQIKKSWHTSLQYNDWQNIFKDRLSKRSWPRLKPLKYAQNCFGKV